MKASDIAKLYNSQTKIINQVVKKNQKRFHLDFYFQLTASEYNKLRFQNETVNMSRTLPYGFAEHSIIMLSGLLKSDVAVDVNIKVINTFICLRKYASITLIE